MNENEMVSKFSVGKCRYRNTYSMIKDTSKAFLLAAF